MSPHVDTAVPDLKVTVEKMIVAGDYVTVHMKFTGRFTGKFGQTQGKSQPIAFIATDLVKVENGRIADNWHIEARTAASPRQRREDRNQDPGAQRRHTCRSTIIFLIPAIAFAGFSPFGHALEQFKIVRQR